MKMKKEKMKKEEEEDLRGICREIKNLTRKELAFFFKKARLCPDSFFTAIKVFKGTNMVKPKDMTEYCLY